LNDQSPSIFFTYQPKLVCDIIDFIRRRNNQTIVIMTEMDFNIRQQHPSFCRFATQALLEPIKIQLKCVIIRLKCCREATIRAVA